MTTALAILIGSVVAAACLAGSFLALRRKRIIDDLPTSKTQGVFIGLAELKGTAESESPLSAYFSGLRCVQYAWKVEEHWSRTVTETHTDNKGHMQTSTRTESGWKQIASGGESAPFYLKDDTGVIRVVPEGATIQGQNVFNVTCRPNDPLYFQKGPQFEIADSTHQRRFIETALALHIELYVLGQARERQDITAAEIARDKNSPMFLISVRSEKQISGGYGRWSWFFLVSGLVFALAGGIAGSSLSNWEHRINWGESLFPVIGYLVFLLIIYIWTTYNNLINLHQRVEQGWSQVEVQVTRRHDLIPNLVQAVEGYRQYENGTQKAMAELRGQIKTVPDNESYHALSAVMKMVIERYPELKANANFMKLQDELVDTEERIALARDYYNDIATFYSNRLEMVPERYVGKLGRLCKTELISASDFERAPVTVKLAE